MHPIDYNLDFLTATLEEMESYLLSSLLYWPLEHRAQKGYPPFPKLTLGSLALIWDELYVQQREMSSQQLTLYQQCNLQWQTIQNQWASALDRKASHGLRARTNLWRALVEDVEAKRATADNYRYEVRHRVMAFRLMGMLASPLAQDDAQEKLQAIDQRLKPRFQPGPFVWDVRLKEIYPEPEYWFLYGQPRQLEDRS